ncbi:hypothetical protein HYC85_032262 [Camellia sinensis]|uniref:Heat shock factor binding protein n=1 Tax=Camellia sinensis TaxID=4442 RepID=A0A7J7FSX9_CAMSI|nr:hypothetical protein HYC85_032262 [Camellia sinensis]
MDGQDSEDPKQSTADMTVFVQNLLQQMQGRFQTMSESIIVVSIYMLEPEVESQTAIWIYCSLCLDSRLFGSAVTKFIVCYVNAFLYDVLVFFLNCKVLDEMGARINELEQSINDLRAEMGAEGSPSPLPPSKKPDDVKLEEGSA